MMIAWAHQPMWNCQVNAQDFFCVSRRWQFRIFSTREAKSRKQNPAVLTWPPSCVTWTKTPARAPNYSIPKGGKIGFQNGWDGNMHNKSKRSWKRFATKDDKASYSIIWHHLMMRPSKYISSMINNTEMKRRYDTSPMYAPVCKWESEWTIPRCTQTANISHIIHTCSSN